MQIIKPKFRILLLLISLELFTMIKSKLSSYSESLFQNLTSNQVIKNYILFDNVNSTNTLFTELAFDDDSTQFPNFSIKMLWFSDLTEDDFKYGTFYGIGQTKLYDDHTFSDLTICKSQGILLRCDDYHYKIANTNDVSLEILEDFQPELDTDLYGIDNIINYVTNKPIFSSEKISPFKSLFELDVVYGMESNDFKNDLNLGFENNITVFIGHLYQSESKSFKKTKFKVMRAATKNFTNIILSSIYVEFNLILLVFMVSLYIL